MENEKICRMMFEAAADRAMLDVVKNIMLSDVLGKYEKHDAICAALGISMDDLPGKSGEPST